MVDIDTNINTNSPSFKGLARDSVDTDMYDSTIDAGAKGRNNKFKFNRRG
jgi:hypothetical protein